MESDHYIGLIIILGIISIALFGGAKNAQNTGGFFGGTTQVQTQTGEATAEKKAEEEAINKTHSQYFGLIKIQTIWNSTDPNSEYIILATDYGLKTTIPITGWTLKTAGNLTTPIPLADILYFSGTTNAENDNIVLYPGDRAYIISGQSPIGVSFRVNKCSGYLGQFKNFNPYLPNICPLARNEDLSSIPKLVENDACFDMIYNYPICRAQTEDLPNNFSYQCKKFITEKLNYNSCVDAHKNDTDFYQKDWRIYLKRSTEFMTNSRYENITLYDNLGKVVDTYNLNY